MQLAVTLRQLRAFISVGRLSSFTRAADELSITQPALSAQIRELEDALNLRLFDRNTRSVSLTSAGEDLLPGVDEVLAQLQVVVERAKEVAAGRSGRIAVAAMPSASAKILPTLVAEFRRAHPGLTVSLHDEPASRIYEMVLSKSVDFGLAAEFDQNPKLEFRPIATEGIVAVLPVGHALARQRSLTIERLLDCDLVLMNQTSNVRRVIDAAYASIGRLVTPAFETTYMSSAVGLVRAGLGVSLLPSFAYEVVSAVDVLVRPVLHPAFQRKIGIITLRDRTLSPAAISLISLISSRSAAWSAYNRVEK